MKRVVKASTGAVSMPANADLDSLASGLSLDDIGELEPDLQDLLRAGVENLSSRQRDDVHRRLARYYLAKHTKEEAKRTFWKDLRLRMEMLFGAVQSFIRQEKKPTRFTTPPLGTGENLNLWQQRMSRVLQSWKRGKRVDVTHKLTDDLALTLYFDDFGDFDRPTTFAMKITQRGELFSVDFQPGRGELQLVLGDGARQQLRLFIHALLEDDRGHKDVFHRFARRLKRGEKPTVKARPQAKKAS